MKRGAEINEWARRAKAERAELEQTGRRVAVARHNDNTGAVCRNVGESTLVHDLEHHDCCYTCNDQAAGPVVFTGGVDDFAAWLDGASLADQRWADDGGAI